MENKLQPVVEVKIENKVYNLYFTHQCKSGRLRQSLPGVIWTIVQLDPLTVEQRITCGFCGLYGRFIEGRWVDTPRPMLD